MTDNMEKGHNAKTGYVLVLPDVNAQANYLADIILHQIEEKKDAVFRIALSGGSTPKKLYELLGGETYSHRLPWERLHLFFGDERMVPYTDEASNFRMVTEALLNHVNIPFRNVHPMPVLEDVEKAARLYEENLQHEYGSRVLKNGEPLFDIVLLGLGTDGHTASLFPDTAVLEEKQKWVSWCQPKDAPHRRMTLTYPAIASSRLVIFVVSGENKVKIFREVREENAIYPSSKIETEGEVHWILDKAAGGE
ncbi:6-phosphogluconolactonase [Commensalibacter sp. M0134]|uniref:6-phosphogluconolactonase n=1 Tax=Commensalibacter TaxID=1079922 RepID=UPI0018DB26F8|nr:MULTISPECIES: 6-phosphogluconolactonase [Commensalibacter]MBI0066429.1 6-phosphogluconolactonase [Commensalibacter sp. M0134]MBI0070312.1 6-phosphogluconolactonase [Commensalibacter sp. M0133]MBI0081744.1 6-phosphogluconolactonase [Commensalibacter melissae]